MRCARLRLAHGWTLVQSAPATAALVRNFIRPAIREVPRSLARRLGTCQISLVEAIEGDAASKWTLTADRLTVSVAAAGIGEHDVALELLGCLGQAAWEKLSDAELRSYWTLLREEIGAGVEGEIDEEALEEKRSLLQRRFNAGSVRRLTRYARASFAGTMAEYVHCLWHEVTVRTGPEHLPAPALRRRLEWLARRFPPNQGQRLFASEEG